MTLVKNNQKINDTKEIFLFIILVHILYIIYVGDDVWTQKQLSPLHAPVRTFSLRTAKPITLRAHDSFRFSDWIRAQIVGEAVCVSFRPNSRGKLMNLSIFFSVPDK